MNILKQKLSLKAQEELLCDCIKKDLSLSSALNQKDLTYDDLRYRDYCDMTPQKDIIEDLDNKEKPEASIPAISFFSGAGGLNVGFEYAGFDNLVSIEFNEIFCNTLLRNNSSKTIIGPPNNSGDVRQH